MQNKIENGTIGIYQSDVASYSTVLRYKNFHFLFSFRLFFWSSNVRVKYMAQKSNVILKVCNKLVTLLSKCIRNIKKYIYIYIYVLLYWQNLLNAFLFEFFYFLNYENKKLYLILIQHNIPQRSVDDNYIEVLTVWHAPILRNFSRYSSKWISPYISKTEIGFQLCIYSCVLKPKKKGIAFAILHQESTLCLYRRDFLGRLLNELLQLYAFTANIYKETQVSCLFCIYPTQITSDLLQKY